MLLLKAIYKKKDAENNWEAALGRKIKIKEEHKKGEGTLGDVPYHGREFLLLGAKILFQALFPCVMPETSLYSLHPSAFFFIILFSLPYDFDKTQKKLSCCRVSFNFSN